MHKDQEVVLIDLDLPLGGVAPMLNLFTGRRHVLDLLRMPAEEIDEDLVLRFAHRYRDKLHVVPAPGELVKLGSPPTANALRSVLDVLAASGKLAIIDLGTTLNALTMEAMRLSDIVYVVTSGQRVANQLHEAFLSSAEVLGLESRRLLPVVNELHGPVDGGMERLPVARIPHATDDSRTKLWLKDQGMLKLVAVAL